MECELGDLAKDELTGFEGIVIAKTEWLTNCTRYTLQPRKLDKDGQPITAQSFDEPHVKRLKRGAVKRVAHYRDDEPGGGPMPAPTKSTTPAAR